MFKREESLEWERRREELERERTGSVVCQAKLLVSCQSLPVSEERM